MKAISQFIVHVFGLIEAEGGALRTVIRGEGRRARDAASSMAMSLALLLIAVPLVLAGVGLLAAGFTWSLETYIGMPLAVCVTGLVVMAAGGGCFYGFRVLAGKQLP